LSGVLFAISFNVEPPSETPDALVTKIYNARYFPAIVFAVVAIFVLTIQPPSEPIPVIFARKCVETYSRSSVERMVD